MCLAVPGQVTSIEPEALKVEFGGVQRRVGSALVPGVAVGDWVLVHAGFAIQILAADEAAEQLDLIREVFADLGTEETSEGLPGDE